MARRRKQNDAPMLIDAGPEAGSVVLAGPVVAPDVQPPVAAPVTVWRVTRTAKVSLRGQLTTLTAGKLVSVRSYGTDGIAMIRQQVELEPVR